MKQSNQSNSEMERDEEVKLKEQKGLRGQGNEMSKRGKLSFVIVISRQINETDSLNRPFPKMAAENSNTLE